MILSELFLRSVSNHISLKHYHSVESCKKTILKFSCLLYTTQNSSLDYFERCRLSSTLAGVETPSNARRCVYQEHPDVANRSEEEIKSFYKSKNITVNGTDVPKPILKFEELSLPENLMRVLVEENYSEPTPIQCLGWPVALSSRDMVGVSQTGSGKTLAYMLPAIVHASANERRLVPKRGDAYTPKVLVLGPTRELVQQIHQVSRRFLQASNLFGACVYGGSSKFVQLQKLSGAEVCVATPGRLLDFLGSHMVSLKECSYLVLDEADRMLDMGFEDQIRDIIRHIPGERQTLMWSATWPKEIRNLAEDFLSDYVHVTVGSAELVANPNIEQNVYVMREDEKVDRLISLLQNVLETEACKILVFAQTKRNVDFLTNLLKKENIPAEGIHGDCSQRQRDNVLHRFRKSTSSILIATDVASRGLDISDIGHIVNYDLPSNIEDYIHRIGRTARGSASGQAHSFFTSENTNILEDLVLVLKESKQPINPELLDYLDAAPWSPPPQAWKRKPSRPYNSKKYNNYNSNKYNSNRGFFNKRYV